MQDNSNLVALQNQLNDLERKWEGVPHKPLAVCRRLCQLRYEVTKEWNRMESEQRDATARDATARDATCTLGAARSPSDQSPLS